MLYSREPRSSVCPSRRTRAGALAARYFACAATMSVPSPLISLLSNSKYTVRFASSPACGPAISSSPPPEPLALGLVAPEPSAPAFVAPASAPGFGALLLQAVSAHANTSSSTAIIRCMDTFSDIPLPPQSAAGRYATSGGERPPRRLPHLSLGSLQPQARQAIGRYRGERAAAAFALRINECSPVGGETRRFIEMPLRQHAHRTVAEVLDRDAVLAVVERHHRKLRAIG